MLYVATVHYQSPQWIDIQASYLRRHMSVPYQTWGSIEGIDSSYASRLDRVFEQRGPHAGKLNHLALEICHVAEDEDLIMFLDGDAFPVADPMPVINEALQRAPLVAVRRAENLDEPLPHPSFCVTTVATWRSLPGDWSLGPVFPAVRGRGVSDVGANLLRTLELSGVPWVPLLRTNGSHVHPLYFGIYGEIVYHHGAGFRDGGLSRVDSHLMRTRALERSRHNPVRRLLATLLDRIMGRSWNRTLARNSEQSRLILAAIQRDDPNWLDMVHGELALERGN
jgi:hypothetical protein